MIRIFVRKRQHAAAGSAMRLAWFKGAPPEFALILLGCLLAWTPRWATPATTQRFQATGPLDNPSALPGQIIVTGGFPGYLKYNGGGPAFLCGPDDPEAFFFLGELQPDGTRAGGPQEEIIQRLARSGASAFHVQAFRMRRCNIKDEGDDTHNPFLDHDPSKDLNPKVLDQWDRWLEQLEQAGVVVIFEFYNDATDVERMGWTLDTQGNLHPHERRFVEGLVRRFKHRKNIIWSLEESANKLPPERTLHFKKMAELIAQVDDHRHPILQSFVIPNDPDWDFPPNGVLSDVYRWDPHIRLVTWLHLIPHSDDLIMQYHEYHYYWRRDSPYFIVLRGETFWRPYVPAEPLGRRYLWAATMAGLQGTEAQFKADRASHEPRLRECGYVARFMEQTDYYAMRPMNELAAGSTRWVLANPGVSYIAYTWDYGKPMSLKDLPEGVYDLLWLDTVQGSMEWRRSVRLPAGGNLEKPSGYSNEVAVYVRRTR